MNPDWETGCLLMSPLVPHTCRHTVPHQSSSNQLDLYTSVVDLEPQDQEGSWSNTYWVPKKPREHETVLILIKGSPLKLTQLSLTNPTLSTTPHSRGRFRTLRSGRELVKFTGRELEWEVKSLKHWVTNKPRKHETVLIRLSPLKHPTVTLDLSWCKQTPHAKFKKVICTKQNFQAD